MRKNRTLKILILILVLLVFSFIINKYFGENISNFLNRKFEHNILIKKLNNDNYSYKIISVNGKPLSSYKGYANYSTYAIYFIDKGFYFSICGSISNPNGYFTINKSNELVVKDFTKIDNPDFCNDPQELVDSLNELFGEPGTKVSIDNDYITFSRGDTTLVLLRQHNPAWD